MLERLSRKKRSLRRPAELKRAEGSEPGQGSAEISAVDGGIICGAVPQQDHKSGVVY